MLQIKKIAFFRATKKKEFKIFCFLFFSSLVFFFSIYSFFLKLKKNNNNNNNYSELQLIKLNKFMTKLCAFFNVYLFIE
jgi:hypothetical protein